MRILVVSAWEPWRPADGACLILHEHLRVLRSRHEVTLVCAGAPTAGPVSPPGNVPDMVDTAWFGRTWPAAADAVLRRMRRGDEPAHVGFVARSRLRSDVRARVANDRPDVVHLFGWGTAALQPLLDGVPVVHDTVDPWSANRGNRSVGRLHALLDRCEDRRVAQHEQRWYTDPSAVVVRTRQDADELVRAVPGARVEVVPNGVDLGAPAAAPVGCVLAFLGAFDARSNVEAARELVTEILPLVQRVRPDARVLLIGRDPPATLRRLAGPAVALTGTVADVRPHLAASTVLVAPLRTGRGVRNKVLEAMAAGRPVTGTPLALQGVPASPGVVVGATPADLAAAALTLLAEPAPSGEANRAAVAGLTWERSAAAVEALWERALQERARCTSTS